MVANPTTEKCAEGKEHMYLGKDCGARGSDDADVEALTKQLDEARVVMRHYVDHVRSHGHADSDAEAMEILLGAGAEEE